MKVGEKHFRSIWHDEKKADTVWVIDQRMLPFSFEIMKLTCVDDVCQAISGMAVRGAPLIGAAAAWGIYLSALRHKISGSLVSNVLSDAEKLKKTRPTAVNLSWAVDMMTNYLKADPSADAVRDAAIRLCDDEVERCRKTGEYGLTLIEEISSRKNGETVNVLTHCNAGWLACIDYGTALAPIYMAHDKGIRVHVWVDETRPRNQGGRLTAWELENEKVPYTLVTDNAGGHLMQNGLVDLVIVGCDRATAGGDITNKIGTYLKALAAYDNNIPFYAAMPVSSIDTSARNSSDVPVEIREPNEVRYVEGLDAEDIKEVLVCPANAPVANYGFDITPAKLVTGLITDRGICLANAQSIKKLLS